MRPPVAAPQDPSRCQPGAGEAPPQSATDVEAQPTRAEQDLVSKFADPDLTVLVHRNQPLISEDSREPDPGSGPPGQEEAPPQSATAEQDLVSNFADPAVAACPSTAVLLVNALA